mmetsp:Transcript_6470/g.12820  ORF Transcript_6470/g.12820 Transcript_6470/m.12820 type:complete len:297 (-) Transcript_6470:277-1167(-)
MDGGFAALDVEVLEEVGGKETVDRQLDTEASSVLDDEDDGVLVGEDVLDGIPQGGEDGFFLSGGGHGDDGGLGVHLRKVDLRGSDALTGLLGSLTRADSVLVLPLGTVNTEEVGGQSPGDGDDTRNHEGPSDRALEIQTASECSEDERHDDEGCSSSQVTPSTSEGVCSAHGSGGEHESGPVLAGDEGGTDDTNEEAKDEETNCSVHKTEEANRDGTAEHQPNHRQSRSDVIAHGSDEDTHSNSGPNIQNVRRRKLFSVHQVEGTGIGRVLRIDQNPVGKSRDGEPCEERQKETGP